ncbi:ImuA family protein [Salinarimonas sp.]|uniref:ImuA family protein n=1 Tax=Salinarimonas sp. TaxID=2766526 RepID=UPI00391B27CC
MAPPDRARDVGTAVPATGEALPSPQAAQEENPQARLERARAALRRDLARLEGEGPGEGGREGHREGGHDPPRGRRDVGGRVRLGAPALDAALGGGLARARLHEVMARAAGDLGAAHGFAAALAARLVAAKGASGGAAVWIQDETAAREDGGLYGPGLAMHGLDPARLLLVRAKDPREALWAAEQALRCRALAAVLVEIGRLGGVYDLTASRRLVLAAREGGAAGVLVRAAAGAGAEAFASAAATRWIVAARPSRPGLAGEPGAPAWTVSLARHRGGREGIFDLEWNHEHCVLAELEALSRDRPAASGDGAGGPPAALPFRRRA